ncbi:MAG: low molecular weight phosphotyrosine protein phosphatase [Muribaculaceae bacterium]|nr:low molecular weight phosphotyrosine protein phosphatase [Muribaculaceae bacterium]
MDHKTQQLIDNLKGKQKIRVLFVCLGNICRSPAAEGVLKAIVDEAGAAGRWDIDSAGTGGWHVGELPDSRMRIHARQRGIELIHHCRKVTLADFDRFDLIIPMDDNNTLNLRRMAPTLEAARKIIPMATFVDPGMGYDHVPDPYYEGSEGFELVLDLLDNGCRRLYDTLTPQ